MGLNESTGLIINRRVISAYAVYSAQTNPTTITYLGGFAGVNAGKSSSPLQTAGWLKTMEIR